MPASLMLYELLNESSVICCVVQISRSISPTLLPILCQWAGLNNEQC